MRILIGYDGSQDSETALTSLRRAGLPAKAEVLVITVATPWPVAALETESREYYGYDVDGAAEAALVPARKAAGKAARQLRRRFPGWKVKSEALVGMAAQSLLERAESWKPDLLVVGSRGHSTLRRMLLGSVSQRIVHHAATDVRVGRATGKSGGPRVLVAVDGSTWSERAVAAVAARKWPRNARARVVTVVDWRDLPAALLVARPGEPEVGPGESSHSWIRIRAEAAARRLTQAGLPADARVLLGDPKKRLLAECRDWKADCLFVGCRGLNALDRFLIGSCSSGMAAHAPCPVEIIRNLHPASGRAEPGRGRKREHA